MQTQAGPTEYTTEPVCGLQVEPATATGTSEYQGTTYYFCSAGCQQQFDRDPQHYLEPPQQR